MENTNDIEIDIETPEEPETKRRFVLFVGLTAVLLTVISFVFITVKNNVHIDPFLTDETTLLSGSLNRIHYEIVTKENGDYEIKQIYSVDPSTDMNSAMHILRDQLTANGYTNSVDNNDYIAGHKYIGPTVMDGTMGYRILGDKTNRTITLIREKEAFQPICCLPQDK